MPIVYGTPGQRLIVRKTVEVRSPGGVSVDELLIHCDRVNTHPLNVAAGTSGYVWLDAQAETSPAKSAFIDFIAQQEGLSWWYVNAANPTASSTQVGPTWNLSPLHFQTFIAGSVPWSAGSRPAIAFENETDHDIHAVVSYGRFA